jgi:hypothetical protein
MTHPDDIERAVNGLRSLHDGEMGVMLAIFCGPRAIPALRDLLFESDRSGLYQARCRAVEVLRCLGAEDVLVEFLKSRSDAADPIERLGDDAVINAAALALVPSHDESVFRPLVSLAEQRRRPGVIKALGTFAREEIIPLMIAALEEDECRLFAERAIKAFGNRARRALLICAATLDNVGHHSESRLRAVRSALGLLNSLGIPQGTWPALRHLIRNADPKIAVLACGICLNHAEVSDAPQAIERLVELLPEVHWVVAQDIEDTLVEHYGVARVVVARQLATSESSSVGDEDAQIHRVLEHVQLRTRVS